MKTNITKVFQVNEPIKKVWLNLSNPREVVECVPGASLTEEIDERNFKGGVTTKFGPVKVKYAGDIEILELDEANYTMRLKGRGLDSKGKGSADMAMIGKLVEKDGGTEVDFNMEITITGMLAQFGSRLINDVSNLLINQFVDNFTKKLEGQEFEVQEAVSAGDVAGGLFGNLMAWLKSLFGGNKDAA